MMPNLRFTEKALSDWMRSDAADSEIVISSRVRIARNLQHIRFQCWLRVSNRKRC